MVLRLKGVNVCLFLYNYLINNPSVEYKVKVQKREYKCAIIEY